MCSTCNYKDYEEFEIETFDKQKKKRLKNRNPALDIHCNEYGDDFKIGVFRIYRCPTCGRKLYK